MSCVRRIWTVSPFTFISWKLEGRPLLPYISSILLLLLPFSLHLPSWFSIFLFIFLIALTSKRLQEDPLNLWTLMSKTSLGSMFWSQGTPIATGSRRLLVTFCCRWSLLTASLTQCSSKFLSLERGPLMVTVPRRASLFFVVCFYGLRLHFPHLVCEVCTILGWLLPNSIQMLGGFLYVVVFYGGVIVEV